MLGQMPKAMRIDPGQIRGHERLRHTAGMGIAGSGGHQNAFGKKLEFLCGFRNHGCLSHFLWRRDQLWID
jgi:hypothetical protein